MAQYRGVYSTDPGPRYERAFEAAHAILRKAADEWSEGNPEDPPTEEILGQVLDIFIKSKFLRRPFGAGPT